MQADHNQQQSQSASSQQSANNQSSNKSQETRIFEYSLSLAVKGEDVTSAEANQINSVWREADAQEASSENKMAKFKKLLGMRFGPRGASFFEKVAKRRQETRELMRQKVFQHQQNKLKQQQMQLQQMQQQQQQNLSSSSVPGSTSSTNYQYNPAAQQIQQHQQPHQKPLTTQPGIPQISQYPPNPQRNPTNSASIPLAQPMSQMGSNYLSSQPNYPQSGSQPNLLLPQYSNLQQRSNTFSQFQSNPQQLAGVRQVLPSSVPGQSSGRPVVTVGGMNVYQDGSGTVPGSSYQLSHMSAKTGSAPNSTVTVPPIMPTSAAMKAQVQQAQAQAVKKPVKDKQVKDKPIKGDKKEPKKKPTKKDEPTNPATAAAARSMMGQGAPITSMMGSNPVQSPSIVELTPEQKTREEISRLTEKGDPNNVDVQVIGDRSVSSSVILPNVLSAEAQLARNSMRQGVVGMGPDGKPRFMTEMKPGSFMMAGSSIGPPVAQYEEGQPWQFYNVIDKSTVEQLAISVLQGKGIMIDKAALKAISMGVQQHLKNLVESSLKVANTRLSKSSTNTYEILQKLIINHGNGSILSENQENIGISWGPDVRHILEKEEKIARDAYKKFIRAEEVSLKAEMEEYDLEKAKAGSKRRGGDKDLDAPWWIREDAAQVCGTLNWDDLGQAHFKNQVAQRHELGAYAQKKKRKFDTPTTSNNNTNNGLPQNTSNSEVQSMEVVEANGGKESNGHGVLNGDGEGWRDQSCPLVKKPSNILLTEDVLFTIKHCGVALQNNSRSVVRKPANMNDVSTTVQKLKLGLNIQ